MLNPYSLPLFLIAAGSIMLGLLVWHQREGQRGIKPFVLLMLSLAIWCLGYGVELAVPTLPQKMLWVQIQYVGIVGAPLATLLFALAYTQRGEWLTPQRIALLSLIPLLTVILVSTNGLHRLVYTDATLEYSLGFPNFDGAFGPWFWVNISYAYFMMVAAVLLLGRNLVRSSRLYRRQTLTMLIGALAPWIGNALHVSGFSPIPQIDLSPFAFSVTGAVVGWSIIRFRLLGIVPSARDLVIETMVDPVIVLDPEGRIIDLNPAARAAFSTGPTGSGIMGQSLDGALPALAIPLKQLDSHPDGHMEFSLTQNGSENSYDVRATALRGDKQASGSKVIVLRDIASIKKAEQALIRARDEAIKTSEFKSRMVAAVSHDFRTPLAAIVGFADMLKQEATGPLSAEQKHAVERIMANSKRLTALVGELLDQSQLEAGTITLHTSKFTPRQLVEPVGLLAIDAAKQKGLEFKITIEESTPGELYGDLSRLNQVLSNLVTNAIKYTNEGGVSVRLFAPDDTHWAMEVRDTGIGIPIPHHGRVFEPFWRARNHGSEEEGGIGLGLAITQQLVKLMDGEISVISTEGAGSTFRVTLPSQSFKERVQHAKAARAGG